MILKKEQTITRNILNLKRYINNLITIKPIFKLTENKNKKISHKSKRPKENKPKKLKKEYLCKYCGNICTWSKNRCEPCYREQSRKVDRPSFEDLKEDINNLGYSGTGRKYGVSDNSIRKWIKNYFIT